MERIKLYFKSVKYSLKLVYDSSKFSLIFYLLTNLATRTFPLANLYIIKMLLDELTSGQPEVSAIVTCVLFYVSVVVLNQAFESTQQILDNTIQEKAFHIYDINLYNKLAKLPLSFIDTSAGRDLVNEVRYTQWTVIYLIKNLVWSISGLYSFFLAFTALLLFNVWFSLLFLVLTIPGIIIDVVYERKSDNFRRKSAPDVRKFSYYRWMLTDAWPAKDVRMYDLTEPIKSRYDTEKDTYRKENIAIDIKKYRTSLLSEVMTRSGEIIFIIFIVLQALDGNISIGDVALYTGFISTALNSFWNMMFYLGYSFAEYTVRMEKVFELEDIECPGCMGEQFQKRTCGFAFGTTSPDDVVGVKTIDTFESLTFDNVHFKYPLTEKYVLQGTSFTLNKGDKLSIVGINGAGKSTLIKLMLGLYQVQSGQILINGFPISDYDIRDVRKMFSVLFQYFTQYSLTLRDNIVLSDYERQYKDDDIIQALKQSGIYDDFDKFEHGVDTYMTRQFDDTGVELSKGQWQKVALSRAYFKNSPIIIFDEPSAALDAEAEDRIFNNFESISENKTGIMISHRISSARISNKVIVLNEGIVSESGTHEELIALDGLYAKLYNMQKEKYTAKGEVQS